MLKVHFKNMIIAFVVELQQDRSIVTAKSPPNSNCNKTEVS